MLCVRNSTKKKIIHSKQDAIMPSPMAARLVIGQRATRLIREPMIHPFCPTRENQPAAGSQDDGPTQGTQSEQPRKCRQIRDAKLYSEDKKRLLEDLNQLSRGLQEIKVFRSKNMHDVVGAVCEHTSHFGDRIQHRCR